MNDFLKDSVNFFAEKHMLMTKSEVVTYIEALLSYAEINGAKQQLTEDFEEKWSTQ